MRPIPQNLGGLSFYFNVCFLFALGHLTSSTDLNLVIARNCLLELHLVTPEGLRLLKEINIYGKIACLNLFTPRHSTPVS